MVLYGHMYACISYIHRQSWSMRVSRAPIRRSVCPGHKSINVVVVETPPATSNQLTHLIILHADNGNLQGKCQLDVKTPLRLIRTRKKLASSPDVHCLNFCLGQAVPGVISTDNHTCIKTFLLFVFVFSSCICFCQSGQYLSLVIPTHDHVSIKSSTLTLSRS